MRAGLHNLLAVCSLHFPDAQLVVHGTESANRIRLKILRKPRRPKAESELNKRYHRCIRC
ncbi:MAG: hypothetical protein LBT53_08260 [Puniceicoccales bacterium]|nr:hypothetical protein [Puniceicoccales bacterium]